LRVLIEQTLDISSVVKDSISPGSSLVMKVQYSSLTILQQLQVTHPLEKRECVVFGVFQQEGTLFEGRKFDLAKEKEILRSFLLR